MIPGRVLLVAVLAIAVTFEQAVALQCRVCNSKENADCLSSPDKIAQTACEFAETTTSGNVDTTTSGNVETTTSGNVETTTSGNVETTPSGNVERTTSGNVETTTSGNVESTTELPKTDTPIPAPTPAKPTENNGTTNGTDGGSPNGLATYVSNPDDGSSEFSEYPSVINRLRRGAFLRDEASSVCFKLVYKDGETDVVERGCAPKSNDPCEKLKEPALKKDAGCYICEKDGCNASSSISLGLTSIIVPALIMMFLRP